MSKLLTILLFIFISLNANEMNNDLDNDLVPNKIDKCPNTPDGVFTDRFGCTQKIKKIIYFEHQSAHLDDVDIVKLKELIELAKEAFGYKLLIEGHTDSVSGHNYNMTLSKKRALQIEKLILKSKIDNNRIETKWYGETMPTSSNVTDEGKAKNRRVEITFY